MATQRYEVAVAMVVEVSAVRVDIDMDAPGTLEEKIKAAAGKKIDVRAGGLSVMCDSYVSNQYVDGVLGWDNID